MPSTTRPRPPPPMPTHRALVLDQEGGVVNVRSRPTPILGSGQVLIRVHACGVNPVDWKVQENGWCVTSWPSCMGTDGAGVVAAVGEGVTRLRAGDRVCFAGWYDDNDTCSFQEYAVCEADFVGKIPKHMSFEPAAGICLASFTAFIALFHETGAGIPILPTSGDLSSASYSPIGPPPDLSRFGSCVTILGGSSSVGQYAIQYAKIAGFKRIIVTSSAPHHPYLRTLGATHLFDRSATVEDLAAAAAAPHPNPEADFTPFVFDAVGATSTALVGVRLLSMLSPSNSGMLVTPSVMDDPEIPLDVDIRGIYAIATALPETAAPYFRALERWLETGEIVPNRFTVVGGLEKAEEALRMSERGVSGVKLVMTIP